MSETNTTTQGNTDGQNNGQTQQANEQAGATPPDFESWLDALPDDLKTVGRPLFDERITGFKTTTDAIREERKNVENQLRDALTLAEKGSKLETELQGALNKLTAETRRADFYEAAGANECLNPKAALALAISGEHFTKTGKPDWNAIRAEAPELFGKAKANSNGNAGSGTGTQQPAKQTMTEYIRAQAGK